MHHHLVFALALALVNSALATSQSSASASDNVIIPVNSAVQTAQLDIMTGMAMPTLSSPPTLISSILKVTSTPTPIQSSTPVPISSAIVASNTTTTVPQKTRMSTVVVPTMSLSMPGMNTTTPTVTGGGEGRSAKLVSLALGVMAGLFAFA
ncbi:hypothetical protein N431DRAFT_505799 [Stipitochalara longipes BDJ]|nr:hypothetical protein N431DRAFT_505799 [Stipitochalara longipes BDJ]